jgi:maltose alpha-D-glucosyltransferase/alpha-amylase
MSAEDWYKDAVFYEIHVRAFYDGNGDGIGDFRGLTEKLDYVRDLGVDCIWLLPMYPSPLRDDGYDIADYTGIHPDYGTLEDFQAFLDAAHDRGLRVIADLVMNHTSDQHPWFQEARSSLDSPRRDFYVWSDSDQLYRDARIIFIDSERSNWSWDPLARQYYWHRFYHHQPDLNFENPAVREGAARRDRRPLPRTRAAGGGQPVARRRAPLLRRRRRVPHGVQLPSDAAHLHGNQTRGAPPHHRHRPSDPGHP